MPLYAWQEPSASKLTSILASGQAALMGHATGAGKTFISLEVARRLNKVPLVITPKSVMTSFARVAKDVGVPITGPINIEKIKTGSTPYLSKGKDSFVWQLPRDSLVIFDEAHVCAGNGTGNSKVLALTKAYGIKALMMSATIAETPLKMRAVGYLLGLHDYTNVSYYNWCREHGCTRSPWGQGALEFTKNATRSKAAMEKIRAAMLDKFVRLRIEDIPEFPDNEIEAVLYDLSDSDTAAVNEIYKEMDAEIRSPTTTNPLVIQLRARQKTELLKIPLLTGLTEDSLEEGKSVVIFISFRETMETLRAALTEWSPAIVHGDQTPEERGADIARFQANQCRVCICMSAAGSCGISLDDIHGGFPRVSFITPSFSAVQTRQCLGRIHRAASKSKSLQKFVLLAGTIEEDIQAAVQRKLKNLDALQDSDLGKV